MKAYAQAILISVIKHADKIMEEADHEFVETLLSLLPPATRDFVIDDRIAYYESASGLEIQADRKVYGIEPDYPIYPTTEENEQ